MVFLMELVLRSCNTVMYFFSTAVMIFCRRSDATENTSLKVQINSLCFLEY